MSDLDQQGLAGAIAASLAEIINRGLGLSGRRAFLVFMILAGLVFAVKVGSETSPFLAQVWDWAIHYLTALAVGTGLHRLWKRSQPEQPEEESDAGDPGEPR